MSLPMAPKYAARMLVGVQTMMFGLFTVLTPFDPVYFGHWAMTYYETAWGWGLLTAGAGLTVPLVLEMWCFWQLKRDELGYRIGAFHQFVIRTRTLGYALSGCIWTSLWYLGLFDDRLTSVDFLGVTYIVAITWLYILDAKLQRKVTCGKEKGRAFVAFY